MSEPVARSTDPETSHMAAADAKRAAPAFRTRCLLALAAAGPGGLTDFELADDVESIQTSAGKRRHELCDAGMVEFAWEHRPSPTGSKARVWRVTSAGIAAARELSRG